MFGGLMKVALVFILTFLNVHAKKPPGYVAPPREYDPNPPKYEYGYRIQEDKATHGKDEQRDGIYAQGRYYVENGTESTQNVKYFADEWGYHSVVEYSNTGPHSKSSARFALGEEAIKLKNNQKSIPKDPGDPSGKADNLPIEQQDPSTINSPENHNSPLISHVLQLDPSLAVQPHFSSEEDPQLQNVQPNDNNNNAQSEPVSETGGSHDASVARPPEKYPENIDPTIDPLQSQILFLHQPQLIVQSEPNLQILTNLPDQPLENQGSAFNSNSRSQASPQPIFYYVDPQQATNLYPQVLNSEQSKPLLNNILWQPNEPTAPETLPQAQALVDDRNKENEVFINESENTGNHPHRIEKPLERGSNNEFGARLSPKYAAINNNNKLIESTRNLVSGDDVLNINAAFSASHPSNDPIDSSTIHTLLKEYVSPTLLDRISSTTHQSLVSTTETNFLKEPIVVAESETDCDTKPVNEETEENQTDFPSTARSTLATSPPNSDKKVADSTSDQVLVTPRPVSSKFLAPITAGIQLQQVDQEIFKNSKTLGKHDEGNGKTYVQVQKTIPYYLGMYQYPLEYDGQSNTHNISEHSAFVEQKAVENVELGKTLLYFPEQESPRAEQLIQQPLNYEVYYDEGGKQGAFKSINGSIIEDQQVLQGQNHLHLQESRGQQNIALPNALIEDKTAYVNLPIPDVGNRIPDIEKPRIIEKAVPYPQPYPVETIVEKRIHVPIEVTKYVDRPYPVEVPVPYPQPYPVEKIVQKVVKEPYPVHIKVPVEKVVERKIPVPYYIEKPVEKIVEKPVEKIVERKVPVPYYIEKPAGKIIEKPVVTRYIDRPIHTYEPSNAQAFLLQVPGLVTDQKYSSLVKNYQSNHIQNQLSLGYPILYAPQSNQYLPSKKNFPVSKGHIQPKHKKLNLLVFPRINLANLPPVTNNPKDLYQSHQFYRQSNAQLNNGYLPPAPQQTNCDHAHQLETSASTTNTHSIRKPDENHIGLVPPKRPLEDPQKHRTARAHFDDKSIRIEYGFMPPLIPSLEIDEHGQPIEKDDNKK